MNTKNHKKLSIKTFLSIIGVASASILMSFPAFAQTTTPSNRDSSTRDQQMNQNQLPMSDPSMQQQTPGSQQMNPSTTGNQQMNENRLPTDDRSMQQQTTGGSQQINTGSTTTETQIRRTTSQQVTPGGTTTPSDTPAATPTDTTPQNTTSPTTGTTQQAPDQGVRALW